jgi:hypothetical protein
MPDVQPADPQARRTAMVIVGVASVAGLLLIVLARQFRPELEAWVTADPAPRIRVIFGAMTLLTAGPVLGMAAYLWQLGQRTLRSGRYPPPGLRVTRDTPVESGRAATTIGKMFRMLAVALASAAVLLGVLLWWLLFSLGPRIAERRI